ncbi:DNA (cytosine-5-)-methyltransferase [Williamsoniiplasma lucivorax]|uniref:Cytosine-specific methyltransferase n=1 Tax=Williamsoniiplasma lucivorax TaxID=209274 RepID=A0A2S5RDX3_9MOLU|nr:DNA (cytosine-5-)-methyltransferase [Williamsoniiplasma lucivorax]PPE05539.1 DNA-methyltransferase [Williamsoniiplasma lucivorax]
MRKIRIFETFAGIGAQHKALEILKQNNKLDYKVVATSEWDVWANISYHAIHNNNENIAKKLSDQEIHDFLKTLTLSLDSKTPAKFDSIKRLSRENKEILYSSLKLNNNFSDITKINGKDLYQKTNGFDLLTYSFPCQDLSTAGSFHGGNQGMGKDSGTRSGLLWQIERILKELKTHGELPKFLLLENVRNMLSSKHIEDYKIWLKFLNKLGYNTQTYLLNAEDFGTPQKRTRVFALSVLNGGDNFQDTFSTTEEVVEIVNVPNSVSDLFKITKSLSDVIETDYKKMNSTKIEEAILSIPNDTPSRKKMYQENPKLFSTVQNENKNFNMSRNKSGFLSNCRTITTKQDRHPNAGVINIEGSFLESTLNTMGIKNKSKYRFLTPRECYMLMGFQEKDFENVIKNFNRKEILLRQAGNSIVVNVLVGIFNYMNELGE